MRRNPFDELEDLFERMEAQFDTGVGFGTGSVPVDVLDAGSEYEVTADLPGYTVDDIDLTYSDRTLHINTDPPETADRNEDRYLRQERRRRSVSRSVRVPEQVLEDEIVASFDDGVLTVTLPKVEDEGDGQRIEIE